MGNKALYFERKLAWAENETGGARIRLCKILPTPHGQLQIPNHAALNVRGVASIRNRQMPILERNRGQMDLENENQWLLVGVVSR